MHLPFFLVASCNVHNPFVGGVYCKEDDFFKKGSQCVTKSQLNGGFFGDCSGTLFLSFTLVKRLHSFLSV